LFPRKTNKIAVAPSDSNDPQNTNNLNQNVENINLANIAHMANLTGGLEAGSPGRNGNGTGTGNADEAMMVMDDNGCLAYCNRFTSPGGRVNVSNLRVYANASNARDTSSAMLVDRVRYQELQQVLQRYNRDHQNATTNINGNILNQPSSNTNAELNAAAAGAGSGLGLNMNLNASGSREGLDETQRQQLIYLQHLQSQSQAQSQARMHSYQSHLVGTGIPLRETYNPKNLFLVRSKLSDVMGRLRNSISFSLYSRSRSQLRSQGSNSSQQGGVHHAQQTQQQQGQQQGQQPLQTASQQDQFPLYVPGQDPNVGSGGSGTGNGNVHTSDEEIGVMRVHSIRSNQSARSHQSHQSLRSHQSYRSNLSNPSNLSHPSNQSVPLTPVQAIDSRNFYTPPARAKPPPRQTSSSVSPGSAYPYGFASGTPSRDPNSYANTNGSPDTAPRPQPILEHAGSGGSGGGGGGGGVMSSIRGLMSSVYSSSFGTLMSSPLRVGDPNNNFVNGYNNANNNASDNSSLQLEMQQFMFHNSGHDVHFPNNNNNNIGNAANQSNGNNFLIGHIATGNGHNHSVNSNNSYYAPTNAPAPGPDGAANVNQSYNSNRSLPCNSSHTNTTNHTHHTNLTNHSGRTNNTNNTNRSGTAGAGAGAGNANNNSSNLSTNPSNNRNSGSNTGSNNSAAGTGNARNSFANASATNNGNTGGSTAVNLVPLGSIGSNTNGNGASTRSFVAELIQSLTPITLTSSNRQQQQQLQQQLHLQQLGHLGLDNTLALGSPGAMNMNMNMNGNSLILVDNFITVLGDGNSFDETDRENMTTTVAINTTSRIPDGDGDQDNSQGHSPGQAQGHAGNQLSTAAASADGVVGPFSFNRDDSGPNGR
jgi:hypothetical protein